MDKLNAAISLLPVDMRQSLKSIKTDQIEEIRLRVGKKPSVFVYGNEKAIRENEILSQEIMMVIEKACGASLQAHLHELREGYISYKGLRVGVCATTIYEHEKIKSLGAFTSVNIRIPHSFYGDISELMEKIRSDNYKSTLIISPPGYGKTSLLRELIRLLSSGGKRVSVVDERNELACVDKGVNYFDMGDHTDILTGVKKSEGAMMLLRGMNPELIAFDEISKREDLDAIYEISGCGVDILATAHGRDLNSLRERPLYRDLLAEKIFKNLITIQMNGHLREYSYQRLML